MSTEEPIIALGLMSGTSMDGIDAALLETDGQIITEIGPTLSVPYPPKFRAVLAAEVMHAADTLEPSVSESVIQDLTHYHIEVSRALFDGLENDSRWASPDLVGFHGHTVLHRPDRRMTLQIGDPKTLSEVLGVRVIADFRIADVSMGGQGAPLAPVFHAAMLRQVDKPVAVVNIGGVSNVTWIGPGDDDLIAFDTGPGNALMDSLVERTTGDLYDHGGLLASKGAVDKEILDVALANSYFEKPWPKSLDRSDFTLSTFEGLELEDGLATLAEFTARSIFKGIVQCPSLPNQIFISGGGRHNHTVMGRLRELAKAPVLSVDDIGWDGDFVEAQAFAYIAVRALNQMPITFPGTTGVQDPMTGGETYGFPK